MRKGFPESYDVELIASVFGDLWAGRAVEVPVYSHEVYDIVGSRVIGPAAVVIVEGVNALGPFAPWCDVGIFLDASEVDLRDWYVERFAALVASGAPFYQQFAGTDVRGVAESVWEAVNLPNLREHILPTRSRADLVLHKGADHAVVAVTVG